MPKQEDGEGMRHGSLACEIPGAAVRLMWLALFGVRRVSEMVKSRRSFGYDKLSSGEADPFFWSLFFFLFFLFILAISRLRFVPLLFLLLKASSYCARPCVRL